MNFPRIIENILSITLKDAKIWLSKNNICDEMKIKANKKKFQLHLKQRHKKKWFFFS